MNDLERVARAMERVEKQLLAEASVDNVRMSRAVLFAISLAAKIIAEELRRVEADDGQT